MTKRTFRLVAIAVLLVVCLCATTLLAACNKESTYYLSSESNGWTMYGRRDTVPDDVRFVVNEDGTYSLTVNLEAGDSFVVYKTGSSNGIVSDIFSARTELTLNDDGKVSVGAKGKYVLTLDVENGELSYSFTAPTPTPSTVAVTGVSLDPTSLNLTVGGADATLTATVAPANATNKGITWSSSDNGVATVNGGVVHAVSAGNATITVTTEDGGKTATCAVTVSASQGGTTPVPVTGVTLNPTSLQMTVGGADATLTATVAPANATNKNVTWLSSDPGIATVNNGVVHAVSAGNATITVTTADGGKTATCAVVVTEGQSAAGEVYEIYYTGDSEISLKKTLSVTIPVTVDYEGEVDTTYSVVVVDGDEDVITTQVVEGNLKITAAKVGEVTIKLVSNADSSVESSTLKVTVTELAIESISITPSSIELEINQETDLTVNVLPAEAASLLSLTWTSNDECVSVVDGHIKALSSGTAIITARDNSGKSAECTVTVTQHVSSIELSESSIVLYVNGSNRELTVTFNPSDATNKAYTAELVSGSEYVQIVSKSGLTITLKGIAAGSATLRITADDDSTKTAECAIEVRELSSAVPYLSPSSLTVNIGETSDAVQILTDGDAVTGFTSSVTNTSVASVNNVSTSTFTVKGLAYGTTAITITVSYGDGGSVDLTLNVIVASDFFYLTGTIDGTSWGTHASESSARSAGVLLDKVSDGVYEITRDIDVSTGNKFYILPSALDTDWNYGLKKSYYRAHSNASAYDITLPDNDNVQVGVSGNYTIRLTISGTSATWTVIGNWIAPTSASIDATTRTLQVGEAESADLELSILPTTATSNVTIVWTASGTGVNFITCNGDGTNCSVALNNFTSDTELKVTVTATITIGSFTVTATCEIALLPQNASNTPSTAIVWSEQGDMTVNVNADGWTYQIVASGNGTDGSVTFELVANASGDALGSILVNDVSGTKAFEISATGLITAKMFGTVYVKVTAADGSNVFDIRPVTFYAPAFYLDIDWKNDGATANASTQTSVTQYTWSEVELNAGCTIVILYNGSDWDKAIRSSGYLDDSSDNASGATGGDPSGKFSVTVSGKYNITLDLSGLKPSVKFEYAGALAQDPEMTVSLYNRGNTYTNSNIEFGSGTARIGSISNNYEIVFTVNGSNIMSAYSGDGWIELQIVCGSTWGNNFTSLSITHSTSSSLWQESGKGNFSIDSSLVSGKTLTFTCTFNTSGTLTKVVIASA